MANKALKIGLIGFGSIGKRHYENLKEKGQNVVVFSKRGDIELARQVKNWHEFFNSGPYDAIFITNETAKHLETIVRCLKLKPKAFFIEKPLSGSSKGTDSLVRILEKNRISAWVDYCLHYFRPLVEIKKLLRKNVVGRIYGMRVFVGQDLRGWRKRDYRKSYSGKKNAGGGVILDLVHDLNYPAWLLEDELRPLAGVAKKVSSLQIDTEDYAESILVSKKKKVLVSVHQDYLRIPGKRSLEIIGTKGTLTWDSLGGEIFVETAKNIIRKKVVVEGNEMYKKEINFFLKMVKEGKEFSNLSESIRDLKIIDKLKKGF